MEYSISYVKQHQPSVVNIVATFDQSFWLLSNLFGFCLSVKACVRCFSRAELSSRPSSPGPQSQSPEATQKIFTHHLSREYFLGRAFGHHLVFKRGTGGPVGLQIGAQAFWTFFGRHFDLKWRDRDPMGLQMGTQGPSSRLPGEPESLQIESQRAPKRYSGSTCRLNIFLDAFWTPFHHEMGRRGSHGTPTGGPMVSKRELGEPR